MEYFFGPLIITGVVLYLAWRIFYWWFFCGHPEIRRDFEEFSRMDRRSDTQLPKEKK